MDAYALVLNAGSSSLKFCVFQRPQGAAWQVEARGQIEGIGTSPRLSVKDARGEKLVDEKLDAVGPRRPRRDRRPRGLASVASITAVASSASVTGWCTAARASAAPPSSRARSWPS